MQINNTRRTSLLKVNYYHWGHSRYNLQISLHSSSMIFFSPSFQFLNWSISSIACSLQFIGLMKLFTSMNLNIIYSCKHMYIHPKLSNTFKIYNFFLQFLPQEQGNKNKINQKIHNAFLFYSFVTLIFKHPSVHKVNDVQN